jgi:hypothetical protein
VRQPLKRKTRQNYADRVSHLPERAPDGPARIPFNCTASQFSLGLAERRFLMWRRFGAAALGLPSRRRGCRFPMASWTAGGSPGLPVAPDRPYQHGRRMASPAALGSGSPPISGQPGSTVRSRCSRMAECTLRSVRCFWAGRTTSSTSAAGTDDPCRAGAPDRNTTE